MSAGARGTPTATYRLQLQPAFPLAAAAELVPYAAALGVSHLHLSPVLEAVPGSGHGYDVTDHARVRAELGGEEGLRHLAAAARAHGLGLILDIVPNHMAVPARAELNGPLWEVLRDGPDSRYASWFDIDWAAGGGRVLLPVLGAPLGQAMSEFRVQDGTLRYGDRTLPLRPGTAHLPLPELLEAQHYRLVWWRLGRTELNYRRFFAVSELIGLRVEDPEVFEATHRTVLRLVAEGVVDGLRVDHPDGLADPAGYFSRLSRRTGGVWTVAEKILGPGEHLPGDWAVAGTTGYDALRHVDAMFIDPQGYAELVSSYSEFTRIPADRGGRWAATVRCASHHMLEGQLAAETTRVARAAAAACAADPELRLRDHAPWALRKAVVELLVRLRVYRPYTTGEQPPRPADVALLTAAAEEARTAFVVPEEAAAVTTVRDLVLGRLDGSREAATFRVRFAQLASALRAKAVEDTAGYRYAALLSAAEVGGDPGEPALPPEAFHSFCAHLQRTWPRTGTVLSTHDTKRSADARARLAALTEYPHAWVELVTRLTARTAALGAPAPDAHLAWTAWQTAFALGRPDEERLREAVLKAAREAALRTGWTEPDAAYEEAAARFLAAACSQAAPELAAFGDRVADVVRANVLGAALLHLTMPGVPDVYRGSETLYLALVDPDNRRLPSLPVAGLAALDAGPAPAAAGRDLPTEKLWLTTSALRLRRARPEWFGTAGDYVPLVAEGPAAAHCLAFSRAGRVITAVTRLPGALARRGGWAATRLPLPPGTWRDLLTGRVHRGACGLATLFATAPVALLCAEGGGTAGGTEE